MGSLSSVVPSSPTQTDLETATQEFLIANLIAVCRGQGDFGRLGHHGMGVIAVKSLTVVQIKFQSLVSARARIGD